MYNLKVKIEETEYPIYFKNANRCIHCGAANTLEIVDIFGRPVKHQEIHPYDFIRCTKCGRRYSIKWTRDEETGEMKPTAVDPSVAQQFNNFIDDALDKGIDLYHNKYLM